MSRCISTGALRWLLAACLWAAGGAAHAQCDDRLTCCSTPPPGGTPVCGQGGPAQQVAAAPTAPAGNPLDVMSGNKYQREVDLPALPGVLGLELVRHYNGALSHRGGALGRGWRLSYEATLRAGEHALTIVQGDGASLTFARGFIEPDRFGGVDPLRGSVLRQLTARGEPTYVWRWPDGRALHFDERGRLTSINAPTGEAVTFIHAPDGKLVRVRDPQGRELGLHHDPLGRIDAISSPVGRFTYAYEGASARLVKVTLPGEPSVSRRYHYEDERHPDLLTGISVESTGADGRPASQRLATWGYDERGWAVSSVKGDGKDNLERVSVQRKALASGASEAVLTNSLGHTTVYRWRTGARGPRLMEVAGPGCASCGETNVRYAYDKLGRLVGTTKLDDRGQPMQATRYVLDPVGRVARTEQVAYRDGKAQAPRLIARYEYPLPPAIEPTLIARPSVVAGQEHTLRIDYNEAGQPTRVTEAGFSPVDEQGQPAPAGTPISRTTTFTYHRVRGRSVLVAADGPLANGPKGTPEDSDITRFGWDATGSQVVSLTRPMDRASRIEYDEQGRIAKVSAAEGRTDVYAYRADGQATSVVHHDGAQPSGTAWRYDAVGRRVETLALVEGRQLPQEAQGFDPSGRLLWHASALGILVQQRYDSEGQLLEVGRYSSRMAQVQRFAHDAQGRLRRGTRPGGDAFSMAYDDRGLPSSVTDAAGWRHRASAVRGTLPARTLHDDFGRAVLTVSPDSGTTLRWFDAANRLAGSQDANGNRGVYEHDAAGRILRQRISDPHGGQTVETSWTYQGARLVALNHPTQSERYAYDERGRRVGRRVQLALPAGGKTVHTVRYERDAQGLLQETTLPDGSALRYRRNGQSQVVALERERVRTPWLRWLLPSQTIARDIERDLVGPWRYVAGNGMETRYERSREGVLARVVVRRPRDAARAKAVAGGGGDRLFDLLGVTTSRAGTLAAVATPASARASGSAPVSATTAAPAAARAAARAATAASSAAAAASSAAAPGALGLPHDAQALIDHRYLWDAQGNLLELHSKAGTPARAEFAYDAHGRLAVAVREQERAGVSRYLYDAAGRRLLSQQGAGSQRDLVAHTARNTYGKGTHRWLGPPPQAARYAADGTPMRIGHRDFTWDALGRLTAVKEDGRSLARYAYSHRGERIGKTAGGQDTAYLYEGGQLVAELDAQGRITRQYLHLGDLPVALIPPPRGTARPSPDGGLWRQVVDDLATVLAAWFGPAESFVFLHANHLGAVEAATDEAGQVVWRAAYEPFGEARVTQSTGFALNLRLPGQYADAETGLHYNRHRYYDPQRGEYLSPDPLGTPDGPNPYAYVRGNPLRYVDPDGLALFAFDGTDNSHDARELARLGGSRTNVARFRDVYGDGVSSYVSGVGTQHFEEGRINYLGEQYEAIVPRGLGPVPDRGGNFTGRERIGRMWDYLVDVVQAHPDGDVLDIDIIGFSRGAAQAREFANRVAAATTVRDGIRYFTYTAFDELTRQPLRRCQPVNLRFMGLFDTVLSTDLGSGPDYRLQVPDVFAHVAHAVALNEYRSQRFSNDILGYPLNAAFWNETRRPLPESLHQGGFPLESIGAGSDVAGHVRIERGFIGAHADIGGGYAEGENQLSFVALNWMVEQAQAAGVAMMPVDAENRIPLANPVIHDQSNALRIGDPRTTPLVPIVVQVGDSSSTEWVNLHAEDRRVRDGVSGRTQREMEFTAFGPGDRSLTNTESHAMIDYTQRPVTGNAADTWNALSGNQTGRVDIQAYMSWLCRHGYFAAGSSQCAGEGLAP